MITLYEACERLALESSRVGDGASHVASALATIYRSEIGALPWKTSERERVWCFEHKQISILVLLVLRDLQRHGRAILVEHGLSDDDTHHDMRMTFAPGHALIIKAAWDKLADAPVWQAFVRRLSEVD